MKKLHLTAALVAAMAPGVALAQSADLTVIGRIVPTACTPTFTGGNVVDLGGISAGSLNDTTPTLRPEQDIELTITCDAPARIDVRATDNRRATLALNAAIPGASMYTASFGLGAVGTTNIGVYALRLGVPTQDGGTAVMLQKQYASGTWSAPDTAFLRLFGHSAHFSHSVGASPAGGPAAATVHTIPLSVVPSIAPGDTLPLTAEIPIDGSMTFDIVQL